MSRAMQPYLVMARRSGAGCIPLSCGGLQNGLSGEVRGVMTDDTAEDGLLDLRGVSLEELLDVEGPSFMSALDRVIAPQHDGGCYGFNSSI